MKEGNAGWWWRGGITTKLTDRGFSISELRSLCGVDTTGLAASLPILSVGLACYGRSSEHLGENEMRLLSVLLCFIDPRVRKIRNETSSCPGIFSRTLGFYYVASSPGSPLPHLLDGQRKLVGCSAIPVRSCPGPVWYHCSGSSQVESRSWGWSQSPTHQVQWGSPFNKYSLCWSKETPPPGGVSYLLCSLIKNPEEKEPPSRICTRCFEGGPLPGVLSCE